MSDKPNDKKFCQRHGEWETNTDVKTIYVSGVTPHQSTGYIKACTVARDEYDKQGYDVEICKEV